MRDTFTAISLLLLLGSIFSSCEPTITNPKENKKSDTKEIRDFLHAFHTAVNQYGLKAEFNYLDSTDDFYWIPPGYSKALNYDSFKSILNLSDEGIRQVNFEWDQLNVQLLTENIASFNGVVKGTITDTSNITINVHQIESGTLIKRKNGWKLLNGQSSALSPSSNYDPKREFPVDALTILILPVGDFILINKNDQVVTAQNKRKLETLILSNLAIEIDKKVKIKVSHETPYMRVHEVLSLFSPNGWTPILSVIE